MNTEKKHISFWLPALISFLLSLIGFSLMHFELTGYGYTFFIVIPITIGFFWGVKPDFKLSFIISVMVGLAAFFLLLITSQLEGMICVIILLPFYMILVVLGIWLGYVIRRKIFRNERNTIKITLYPLIILLFAGGIEHIFGNNFEQDYVESILELPHNANRVYDYIKSVDTLEGEKPLLMKLGLAIPQKCVLENESAGAKRVCYFDGGSIEEKVTEIKPGESLKMKVTDLKLPGLKWLKFEDANYTFFQNNNTTKVTRTTTYQSKLKPRFYWRFWEKQAIKAEHEYVLNDLKRRLEER